MSSLFEESNAVIEGTYRYLLERTWDPDAPHVAWIMLNPSTADATEDDPTIRRCAGYARKWGCGGIKVANLFAYRSPSPSDLKRAEDPIGDRCDDYICMAVCHAKYVVVAWGTHGSLRGRASEVCDLLYRSFTYRDLHCLGKNGDGSPKHPLYLPKEAKLSVYLRGYESPSTKAINAEVERIEALAGKAWRETWDSLSYEEKFAPSNSANVARLKVYQRELRLSGQQMGSLKHLDKVLVSRVSERVDYEMLREHGDMPFPEWLEALRTATGGVFDGVDAEAYVRELRGDED